MEETEHRLLLRNLEISDYADVKEIFLSIYPKKDGVWTFEELERLIKNFPEGQICIEDKGKVVAIALSIIVDYSKFGDDHTYAQIVGTPAFINHDPDGNVLYGIDICVHKFFRNMRLGRRLYDARKEICEQLELKAIIAGGRMPFYNKYADRLSPREYINMVTTKEVYDPVLTFQITNGFHVKKILKNYLPMDAESHAYATLIGWDNVYYTERKKTIEFRKTFIRIGVVQWQMRNVRSLESFFENIEFFIDAVSGYKADFILFPELFNVPLMAQYNEDDAAKAIRKLADVTEDIRDKLVEYALSYNINIIAGSFPLYEEGALYNVSYLCRRDGTWDSQYKIHITPSEVNDWGMVGGNKIKVFDTDVARIGIQICYDVEFPELSRILSEQGMQILFIPFATDTRNGYLRVRRCAQARAVENECFVAIAGSVGNLPKVKNMDIQYAQSAVFSPSDYYFPNDAIVAESTPNTEMTIIADLDLDLLKELHTRGSVRNLTDRRTDLYEIHYKGEK